jgi:hypothetical protein
MTARYSRWVPGGGRRSLADLGSAAADLTVFAYETEVAENPVLRERSGLQQMVLPASDPSGPRTAFG